MSDLQPLIEKLERAGFSGELVLHFYAGQVDSARLTHDLAHSEFRKPLPVIEGKEPKDSQTQPDLWR